MAKTFNYGAGIWATKTGSSMAYNDENDNYKPLPFSVTRDSIATRVNKQGLIEVVGKDKLRIDYTDSSKGVALLEPARTNVIVNSEVTSTWTYTEFGSGSAGTITIGKTDMFGGTNAVQVDFPSDAENATLTFGQTTSSISSGSAAVSVYIKLVSSGSKELQFRCSTGVKSNVLVDTTEFVRYEVTGTKGSNESFSVKVRPSEGTSSGGFSIIVCHPQEEAGSYATSYIPTSGLAAQRSSDVANGAGNSEVFNDSEGVLFVNTAYFETSRREISINNGSINERVSIRHINSDNTIGSIVKDGGTTYADIDFTLSSTKLFTKAAFKYKSGDSSFFVNGFKVDTSTDTFAPSGFSQLDFDEGDGTENFIGKAKEIGVYDAVLTDAELEALTSYTSFTNMANELNLTIK
jgi:hypothetical protein